MGGTIMLSELNGSEMGAFLPGLKKVIKKIGKVTSPITTGIAKTFLPSSFVDAAARLDPTKARAFDNAKKAASELLQPQVPSVQKENAKSKLSFNPAVIGIGVAAIAALVLLKKRR